MKARYLPLVAAVLATAACADMQNNPKQTMGTLGGAVVGGLAGSQFGKGSGQLWMTGLGTVLGAMAGSEIGKSLDKADHTYANQTAQQSLETTPTGQSSSWKNPDSGNSGTITPTKTIEEPSGEVCREYTQTINVGGKTEQGYGKACRQADGSWKIVQ